MEEVQTTSSQQPLPENPNQKSIKVLDNKSVAVILFLCLIYPVGVILMWAWMKTWPRWMKLVLSLYFLVMLFAIGLSLYLSIMPFTSNTQKTYSPPPMQGTTNNNEQSVSQQSTGVKEFDQADDIARKSRLQLTEAGLKKYYTDNKKPPEKLEDLVPNYVVDDEVFLDIRTKKPFTYTTTDSVRGCEVSTTLSTGDKISIFCK